MQYKKPLSYEDQVLYLESSKNVIVSNRDNAIDALKKCNYINLITPFKHEYALRAKDARFECIRDNAGNHIYPTKISFESYEQSYSIERKQYPGLYYGIQKFEMAFKSLIANTFLVNYKVTDLGRAIIFFDIYDKRVDNINLHSQGDTYAIAVRRKRMHETFDRIKRSLTGYQRRNLIDNTKFDIVDPTNIYLMFDRLSLSDLLTVYVCMNSKDRSWIFNELSNCKLNLGSENQIEFMQRVFNLVSIRNTIMHFNSLTILLKYSDYTNKTFRSRSSIQDYEKIIRALGFIAKHVKSVGNE
jgi:hypothetical protein